MGESETRVDRVTESDVERPSVFAALTSPMPTDGNRIEWPPLEAGLLAATRPVRHPLESGWLGHVPFMFAIVAVHRPHRFAELGTHHGLSFFAACQAVRDDGLDCQCVAVDHWQGDPHAGLYGDDVFRGFVALLDSDYAELATYVRATFDEAAERFEDGSVDLLHIDGFHSYEAVSHDFATWRPKLSSRGVAMFHDVNEHQPSFGVWRFWREIEAAFPGRTLFFGHSHGLGVLSLDDDESSPVNVFLRECDERPTFVQQYFSSLGSLVEQARADAVAAGRVEDVERLLADVQTALKAADEREERARVQLAEYEREIAELRSRG